MGPDWVNAFAAWVSAIGTWVASGVVIVSVFILRAQLRDTRRTMRSASAQGAYALWVSVDQFFVQHPELKAFIYEQKPLDRTMDENPRRSVESAIEMIADSMANLFHQLANFTDDEGEAYGNFIKDRYQSQPAVKRFIDDNSQWYPNSYVKFLRSNIEWRFNEPPAQHLNGRGHE